MCECEHSIAFAAPPDVYDFIFSPLLLKTNTLAIFLLFLCCTCKRPTASDERFDRQAMDGQERGGTLQTETWDIADIAREKPGWLCFDSYSFLAQDRDHDYNWLIFA